MRYLRTFGNHNNYEDFTETEAFVKPNVSYCITEDEVHYNPIPIMTVKYNVTDASEPTLLYAYYFEEDDEELRVTAALLFDKVEIDCVDASITNLDAANGQTQLSVGEHTVKYTLKDPTSIVDYTFDNCNSIKSVNIPNSVTSIGEGVFNSCEGLTSVTIPNSVTSIGNNVFWGCTSLTSIIIPNSVTSIGEYAFMECSGLTSVIIPNSVTTIGGSAFSDCTGLTSVTIPNSVTSIGGVPFPNCSGLTSIKVESGNTTYDSRNDCNAIIETASNTLVAGCKNTVIPNSVTSVGVGAFWDCTSLTSLSIPNSVTSIEDYAFYECSSLTSITIPNSVTSVGEYAFDSCSSLTSVTIGNSVTSIGELAFYYCKSLTSIVSLATTAPIIKNDTFNKVKTNGTLTVPSGSSGYDVWMGTGDYYLGKYSWTKVEQ